MDNTLNIHPAKVPDTKKIGMVSLGCPKALVDSERILTRPVSYTHLTLPTIYSV